MTESTFGNVPQIRFKGFEGYWAEKTLGALGRVAMNKRVFKHQTSETGDIPFYKIGTFGKEPDAFISRKLFDEYKRKFSYPQKGDLLLSASGSIGRIVEYSGKDEYFQDSNIVWIQHDGAIVNAFLKQFYSFVEWAGLEGSTIKRLYNKNILETRIVLPKKEEQTQIGNYFRELDSLIGLHQREHDKLVTLKKAMLQRMFPQPGTTTPEIRFKGFEGDWVEKKVGDIFNYERPDRYIVESSDYSKEKRIPVLTANKAFILGYTNETRTFNKSCLIFDDFTLEARFVDFPFMVKSSALKLLTTQDCEVDDLYFSFLTLKNSKIEIMGHARHYIGIVQTTVVRTPEIVEQQKIGTYFRTLDALITQHATQFQKLQQLKSACLEKMFV